MGEFDDLLPQSGFDDLVPKSFANVQSGSQTTAKPLVQFNPDQPDFGSDVGAEQRALQGSEATRNAIAREVPREVGGSLLRSVSGLLGAAGGGLQVMAPTSGIQDDAFHAADQVKAMADSLTANDQQPAAKFAGSLIGGAAGGFVGDPMAQGMQTIREGGSLGEAEKRNAIGSAANVAGLGLGMLGSQGEGLAAYASRAAYQVPGNVGIAAGTAELEGRDPTMQELGLAAGMGLAGAVMRSPEHAAALDGKLGPEAQGTATAQTILQATDHVAKAANGDKNPISDIGIPTSEQKQAPTEVANGPAAPVDAAAPKPDVQAKTPYPLPTLYHGTRGGHELTAGHEGSASDSGANGVATYLTSDGREASIWARREEGSNVRPVEATLQNPKVFERPQDAAAWQGELGTDSPEAAARITQKYRDAGHDGVIIKNNKGEVQHVVVLDPENIRGKFESAPQAESPTPARDQMPPEPSQEPVAPTGRPAGDSATVEGTERPAPATEGEPPADVTRIRKADIAADRVKREVEALPKPEKETWEQSLARAQEKLKEDPEYGHSLAKSLIESPRPISAHETAALAQERVTLRNASRRAAEDAAEAIGSKDEAARQLATARLKDLEDRMQVNDEALMKVKPELGRGLNIHKMILADDYSLVHIKNVAKAKAGGELSKAQEQKITELTAKVAEHEKALADLLDRLDKGTQTRQRAVPKSAQERAQANTKALVERLKAIPKEKQMIDPNCVV